MPKNQYNDWVKLNRLIAQLEEDAVTESWKGGEDPEDIPAKELQLENTKLKLVAHLQYMEANYAKKP